MVVGVLPKGMALPTAAVSGAIATREFAGTVEVPGPILAMILREYGS